MHAMNLARPLAWLASTSLLCALAAPLAAQDRDNTEDHGYWLGYFGQGSLSFLEPSLTKWRWWLDVQDRQLDDGHRLDQFLLRPGVGYKLTDSFTLWAGYAFIFNDPTTATPNAVNPPFNEDRFWQQTTWTTPVLGCGFQWRNRLEERFLTGDGETNWRLREFFKLTIPLVESKNVFVSLWDEIFFDLNEANRQREGCRQNRAFAGLGFALDEARKVTMEVGYLNQWIDVNNSLADRFNHIVSVSFFTNF